jgi:hypothetical protein
LKIWTIDNRLKNKINKKEQNIQEKQINLKKIKNKE